MSLSAVESSVILYSPKYQLDRDQEEISPLPILSICVVHLALKDHLGDTIFFLTSQVYQHLRRIAIIKKAGKQNEPLCRQGQDNSCLEEFHIS